MKIKKIKYWRPPKDLINGTVEVFVTLEDNSCYLVEITTPQFLEVLMEESKFLPPCYPYIIVSELTVEIMKAAIEDFIREDEDCFWLKLYHVAATLNIEDINEILDRKEKEDLELDLKIEAEIKAESKINLNIPSDNRIIFDSIFFLLVVSLISYCFLKPKLFDLFSSFID